MKRYYVVATDINGKEYSLHGGYASTWDGNPYDRDGYATMGIAKGVLTKQKKSNEEWNNRWMQNREHNKCTYRIEEVEK